MAGDVVDGHGVVLAQHGGETFLGGGELRQVEQVPVVAEPLQRGPDAQLDPPQRVGLVTDRRLLAAPETLRRGSEDLEEEVLLRLEVPVEDALADTQRLDDLGHRRRVVAPLGEQPGRLVEDLLAAFPAALGQLALHPPKARNNLTSRSIQAWPAGQKDETSTRGSFWLSASSELFQS